MTAEQMMSLYGDNAVVLEELYDTFKKIQVPYQAIGYFSFKNWNVTRLARTAMATVSMETVT